MSDILVGLAPIFAVSRHRLGCDGKGITTLVTFQGCPLRCKYCINKECFDIQPFDNYYTPERLLEEVNIDNLYFIATGGGVTFGGGEPLLRSEFIERFCQLAPKEWSIYLESSLNVPKEHLRRVMPFIDHYFIDIKDFNPDIYKRYTGRSIDRALANLSLLMTQPDAGDKVTVRVPHIPDFNTDDDVDRTIAQLQSLGVTLINEFDYIVE